MPSDNSLNTGKGREFQRVAADLMGRHFSVKFRLDYPMPIGTPPKQHRFDLVSDDKHYIGECKNYAWTEGNNVPSAKMGFINEALFYLSFCPPTTVRFVVMRKDIRNTTGESLADYYFRTYRHLRNGTLVIEIDISGGTIRVV